MIIGLGSDLIDIRRIEKTLDRFGDRFITRIFTETGQRKSEKRKARAASYAKRFAAKEAASKALGTAIRRSVAMQDFIVQRGEHGRPLLSVAGRARAEAERLGISN